MIWQISWARTETVPGRTALEAKDSAGRVKMPRTIGLGRRFDYLV
jgi:hypothetical protein